MTKTHTDREYENQLAEIREKLLLMAGRVESMISGAVLALVDREPELARRTIGEDAKVNRCELEIDQLCLLVLAKRQPMASDLRFITLTLKMVTDLERIGDIAVNICERAIDLAGEPPLGSWDDVAHMSKMVQSMVRKAIDVFVDRDADAARGIIERDDEVDELYTRIFRDVLRSMLDTPSSIETGIHVLSVAKWLERIADHATNLAEQVIFMVKGMDLRHIGKLDERRDRT